MDPREESPLIQNPRVAVRDTALRSVLTISENSSMYIFTKLFLSVLKISVSLFIIVKFSTHTDQPLITFIYLLLATESVDILCFLYFLGTDPTNRNESVKRGISTLRHLGSLTYLVSHILGNVWYYTCDNCYDEAPELTVLSLVFIILGYINFCIPCLLCCCLCLCLPILIIFVAYSTGTGQNPASEEIIQKLAVEKWTEGSVECVICFVNLAEGEEVIRLNCDVRHVFHEQCLKRWLRINNSCPICRKSIE